MQKDQEKTGLLVLCSLNATVDLISCHKKVTKSPYPTAEKSLCCEEAEKLRRAG